MSLTLYYHIGSAPCRAVYLTLKNLGLEFESKVINVMAGENKSDEYLKLNPQGTIPVVVDDDFAMNESRAICCYLVDAKSPGSTLYPTDVKARYIIDQRLFYDATTFGSAVQKAVGPIMREGKSVVPAEAKAAIFKVLNTLESFLEGQEWFSASENVSIADFSILAVFTTLYHVGLDLSNYPNLAAWYERCQDLPGADENERGAKMFGSIVRSKLTEPF